MIAAQPQLPVCDQGHKQSACSVRACYQQVQTFFGEKTIVGACFKGGKGYMAEKGITKQSYCRYYEVGVDRDWAYDQSSEM